MNKFIVIPIPPNLKAQAVEIILNEHKLPPLSEYVTSVPGANNMNLLIFSTYQDEEEEECRQLELFENTLVNCDV